MSCKLLQQDDWLEYPTGANFLNKVLLVSIAIIGGILLGFEIWLEKQLTADLCKTKPSSSVTGLLRALQIIAAVMIVVPAILLVIDYATANKVSTFDLALPAAFLMSGLSAALLIIIGALQSTVSSECVTWPMWIWIPVGVLALASFSLLFYRWKSKSSTFITKRKVDWNNSSSSESLVRELGRKQGEQCGVTIESNDALAAFAYYVQKRPQKAQGFWGRLTNQTPTIEPLPDSTREKFPNIFKMYTTLKQDLKGKPNWQSVKISLPQTNSANPTTSSAEQSPAAQPASTINLLQQPVQSTAKQVVGSLSRLGF